MPRQNEPPSSETASPVTVRRAVAVPGPAQDPGAALGPRVPAPEPAPAPAPDPAPVAPAPAAAAGKRFGKPRSAAQQRRPKAKPETEPGAESVAESKEGSAAEPEAAARAEPEAVPSPLATAAVATAAEAEAEAEATVTATGAGASEPADQHPSRPRGPLLAAAGIAGALLISVPFLVLAATGDDDDRSVATAPAGGTTLDPGTSDDELPADYAAESPSPSPSPSKASASAKSPSPAEAKAAPHGAEEKTAEEKTKEPAAEKTTKAARAKKKTTTKKASAPTARELANAASSQSAVLLKNTATGKCADVPGYGKGSVDGPVRQYICRDGGSDNQQWDLNVVSASGGPGGASLFVIKNVKDGLCFDLPKYGSVGKGTQVTEFPCDTTRSDNHLWYLEPRAGGTYALRNLVANLCLGVNGGKTAGDDAELQVMTCGENQYTAQRWVFS